MDTNEILVDKMIVLQYNRALDAVSSVSDDASATARTYIRSGRFVLARSEQDGCRRHALSKYQGGSLNNG